MPHSASSDLVLHCLLMSHKKDTRLKWIYKQVKAQNKRACPKQLKLMRLDCKKHFDPYEGRNR